MARRRITVSDACVGARLCQMAAPELFRMNEAEGRSEPRQPEVEDSEELMDAAEGCPQEAIVVHDAQTGEQLFP
jgi:ferredoxin